jgi:hypothetical protein
LLVEECDDTVRPHAYVGCDVCCVEDVDWRSNNGHSIEVIGSANSS